MTAESRLFNASTISFPNPFHPKMNSTKLHPQASTNHPEIAVTTGFNEFLKRVFG
jgi:hypothetical protein